LLGRHDITRAKINLIPHNGAPELNYRASTPEAISAFKARLESRGVDAYIRTPRGRDIFAACGQLAANDAAGKMGEFSRAAARVRNA
jgi:23S rRNA (adenine2503-C2)-methyltransferase